jgi:TATA-box binding protein (TBP) (component of TFIID and TFIIIB)
MVRTEIQKHFSELVLQALSDESIKMATPMSDFEVKVFAATIDRLATEETLPAISELIIEPRRIITLLQTANLPEDVAQQARKTLRRFREVIINLADEPEIKIVN